MCLAVPGRILSVQRDGSDEAPAALAGGAVAEVDFQGSRVEVSLAMTPEAGVGDWVLVHAGFAITLLDEEEARETWEYLDAGGLGEMPAELQPTAGDPLGPDAAADHDGG